MTSLTEQLSAVRQSQWNTQLDLIGRLGSRTLDRSEQLIELNIKTSRASVEQAAGVVKQLFEVREPRDLFALGAHAQDQWQQLFSYGRALMGIAAGAGDVAAAQVPTLRLLPAPVADVPTTPSQVAGQAAIAVAEAATVAGEMAGAATDIGGAVTDAALDAVLDAGADVAPVAEPAIAPSIDTLKADVAAVEDAVSDPIVSAESSTTSVAEAVTDAADATASTAAVAPDTDAAAPVIAVEAHPAPVQSVEAVLEDAIADANVAAALPAKAKPLVEALHDATHAQAGIAHPLASTVPLASAGHVELPHVTPADHAPAVPSQGPAAATRERRTTKRK